MKLRFSIRDMLWLTLVVAMGLAWWLDGQRLIRQRRAIFREQLQTLEALTEAEKQLLQNMQQRELTASAMNAFQQRAELAEKKLAEQQAIDK